MVLDIEFVLPGGRTVKAAAFGSQFNERFQAISGYLDSDQYYKDIAPGIFDVLEKAMTERFDAEGAALGGEKWSDISLDWAILKAELTGQSKIGEFTGDLRRSLTERNAPGAIRKTDGPSIIFGSAVPYAKYFAEFRPLFEFDRHVDQDVIREFQRAAVAKAQKTIKRGMDVRTRRI